ncbi:MAG: ECF-type sigma factor [Planctomycetota bacterium]
MHPVDRWFEEEYSALRATARCLCARERKGHTLTPTALVNQAFVTLRGTMSPQRKDSRYWHAAVIRTMKRTLIDYARSRKALKRQGPSRFGTLTTHRDQRFMPPDFDRLEITEFLKALEHRNRRAALVFSMRIHTNLGMDRIAKRLGVSRRTATADWRYAVEDARAWVISNSENP